MNKEKQSWKNLKLYNDFLKYHPGAIAYLYVPESLESAEFLLAG